MNIWAIAYAAKAGEALRVFEPFVSKDIDLYGPQKILYDLASKYHVPVTLSPPRLPGIGQVIIPKGDLNIKVELLNGVKGLRRIGEEHAVKITVQGATVRVLDPVSCLMAKIANAAGIDQTTRQDVKHVQIMKICAREYAKDFLAAGEQKVLSERDVVDLLNGLKIAITSDDATKVEKKWGVTFEDVLPVAEMETSSLTKVQRFLHLGLRQNFATPETSLESAHIASGIQTPRGPLLRRSNSTSPARPENPKQSQKRGIRM